MSKRGRVVGVLTINPGGVPLDLEEHIAQPIALAPAPVALAVVGIFRRDILETIASIEPICRSQADQGLLGRARIDVDLRLAAQLLEGRNVDPASLRRRQNVSGAVAQHVLHRVASARYRTQRLPQATNGMVQPVTR